MCKAQEQHLTHVSCYFYYLLLISKYATPGPLYSKRSIGSVLWRVCADPLPFTSQDICEEMRVNLGYCLCLGSKSIKLLVACEGGPCQVLTGSTISLELIPVWTFCSWRSHLTSNLSWLSLFVQPSSLWCSRPALGCLTSGLPRTSPYPPLLPLLLPEY